MPVDNTNKIEITPIKKTSIEPNEFIPNDSFHELPENKEIMQIKGKQYFIYKYNNF